MITEGDYDKSATFSDDRVYRYVLHRFWDHILPVVQFIGLNPSTADAQLDDATIRVCRGFSERWGYGGFLMTNLFAYRATNPADMKAADDPVGPANDQTLKSAFMTCDKVVAVWGNHGTHLDRARRVIEMTPRALHCIRLLKTGVPGHPLHTRYTSEPKLYWDGKCDSCRKTDDWRGGLVIHPSPGPYKRNPLVCHNCLIKSAAGNRD